MPCASYHLDTYQWVLVHAYRRGAQEHTDHRLIPSSSPSHGSTEGGNTEETQTCASQPIIRATWLFTATHKLLM